jgi:hypothetical protein
MNSGLPLQQRHLKPRSQVVVGLEVGKQLTHPGVLHQLLGDDASAAGDVQNR